MEYRKMVKKHPGWSVYLKTFLQNSNHYVSMLVFWVLTQNRLAGRYLRFGRTYASIFRDEVTNFSPEDGSSIFLPTLVSAYNPEDQHRHLNSREYLKHQLYYHL
jgi:hypothetical protein